MTYAFHQLLNTAIQTSKPSFDYVEENIDRTLLCPICHDPFFVPVITQCGHTFCERCIINHVQANRNPFVRPIELLLHRHHFQKFMWYLHFNIITNYIYKLGDQTDRLQARCKYKENCSWKGKREEYKVQKYFAYLSE